MSDTAPKQYAELLGKIAIILFFAVTATLKAYALVGLIANWSTADVTSRWTYLAAHVCTLAFLTLVIATTIARLKPMRGSEGLEPRLSALGGTLLGLMLGLLPPVQVSPGITLLAVGLSALGGGLSAYVLAWLGRSFSIMPQARKLVTRGPYAVVRHPLYCTEELMTLGVMLLVLSPIAIAIVIVHWAVQMRRMFNEEKVLRAEFPEYDAYAAVTPRVIPRFFLRKQLEHNTFA